MAAAVSSPCQHLLLLKYSDKFVSFYSFPAKPLPTETGQLILPDDPPVDPWSYPEGLIRSPRPATLHLNCQSQPQYKFVCLRKIDDQTWTGKEVGEVYENQFWNFDSYHTIQCSRGSLITWMTGWQCWVKTGDNGKLGVKIKGPGDPITTVVLLLASLNYRCSLSLDLEIALNEPRSGRDPG